MKATCLVLVFTVVSTLPAQCGGSGALADLRATPFALGTTASLTISGAPAEVGTIFIAPLPGLLPVAGLGNVCLDLGTIESLLATPLPAGGAVALPIPVPNDPLLLTLAVYSQGIVTDPLQPLGLALTQAVRVDFENADGYTAMPAMAELRVLSGSSLLDDGRVLITGGGSGSFVTPLGTPTCEVFDPYLRTTTTVAPMASLRAYHTQTTLTDGRVLVCGGASDFSGTVTDTCEIYDPQTDTWSAAASMSVARSAHNATLLLDGRVLVTGGTDNFLGTISQILNGSSNTGEIYDPVTDLWSPVSGVMASPRFQAAAVLLDDGRVLITAGISGATSLFGLEQPLFTSTANYFDPMTDSFSVAPSLPLTGAVVAHRMSLLPNGDVWSTGGADMGLPFIGPGTVSTTYRFNGVSWTIGPSLPNAVAYHDQVVLSDGSVQIFGGLSGGLFSAVGTTAVVRYDGTTLSTKASLPVARGLAGSVVLEDGSVVLAGGADINGLSVDSVDLYTPDP